MRFSLITFGTLTLTRADDGAPVGSARRKPLALLALVAAHGPQGLPRERAAALLWPEAESPARARHTLAQTLYGLRRELGTTPVLGGDPLRLDPEMVATDLARFQDALARGDADEAAAVFAGPFLDGIVFAGCTEFDRWAERQRRRLEAELVNLLAADARRASTAGAPDVLARWVRAHAAAPADPDLALATASALAGGGRHEEGARLLERHLAAAAHEQPGAIPDERIAPAIESLRAAPSGPAPPPAAGAAAPPADAPAGADRRPASSALRRVLASAAVTALLLAAALIVAALVR